MGDHGAYGQRLGDHFHLASAPAFVTWTLRKSEIAVTEIKCDVENNGLTSPIPREDAFLVTLQLRDCPRHELWIDDRPALTAALPAGVTCLYDLRTNPIAYSISAFHSLHFYLPRRALDAIADLDDVARIDDLDCREPGIGVNDRIIRQLGLTLLPAFDRPDQVAAIFVDHVTVAIAAHVARAYRSGHAPSRRALGGLAPWQELRAKEILDANLDGDFPIEHLAKECGVPLGDFARAFRESTGMAPHQWLLRARIDKAKNLLRRSGLSQTEVARVCGFADEAHFIRVFARHVGTRPGAWRRG